MANRQNDRLGLLPSDRPRRKRVKLRLRWAVYCSYAFSLCLMWLAMVAIIVVMYSVDMRSGAENGIWLLLVLVFFGVPLLVFLMAMLAAREFLVFLRWMTREEARSFPLRRPQWPAEWLEEGNGSADRQFH